jgi:hypothetical protein
MRTVVKMLMPSLKRIKTLMSHSKRSKSQVRENNIPMAMIQNRKRIMKMKVEMESKMMTICLITQDK